MGSNKKRTTKFSKYTEEEWAEIKHLFVEKEYSAKQICELPGMPHYNTILNRAKKRDRAGKTWYDYRDERSDQLYAQLSPQNQAHRIMTRINALLDKPVGDDAKFADAIYKLNSTMQRLVDKDFQVPMFYHFAEQFVKYCKEHHSEVVTQEFIDAVRAFKNHVRARLTGDLS